MSIITRADLAELEGLLEPVEELREAARLEDAAIAAAARSPTDSVETPNSQALGAVTGAPARPQLFQMQVSSAGVRLVAPDKQSRSIVVTAPAVNFGIFLSLTGRPDVRGFPIPPLIPYELIVPGFQELWAATNAPVWVPVLVQEAPLLIGNRERRWSW